jgi:hypothetical protein
MAIGLGPEQVFSFGERSCPNEPNKRPFMRCLLRKIFSPEKEFLNRVRVVDQKMKREER